MKPLIYRLIGRPREAAQIYYRRGSLEKAARMYLQAREPLDAARLWLRSGREKEALIALEQVGSEHAAGLLSEEGREDLAIPLFEEAGAYWQAAECARRLGRTVRAARLFEQAGAFEQAAASYAHAGDQTEVLRVWRQWSEELGRVGRDEEQRALDGRRAKLHLDLGELEIAAELLERHQRWSPAARIWQRVGRNDRAILALVEAGSGAKAAELMDRSGAQLASETRARILSSVRRHVEAAEAYEEAGDLSGAMRQLEAAGAYGEAARRAERKGDPERAAELYQSAGAWSEALRVLEGEGRWTEAADVARRAGLNAQAAAVYLKLKDPLRAAQEFIKADQPERAIDQLANLAPNSSDGVAGQRLLVPLLVETARYEAAERALQALADESRGGMGQPDSDYWLGRVNEGLGRFERACEAYRRLVAERPRYRDAAARLQRLEAGARSAARESESRLEVDQLLHGRYRLEKEVGRGGSGRVFRGRDVLRRRPVAVKVLSTSWAPTTPAREQLFEEVRLCRRLRHPSIRRVYEFGEEANQLFLVMEWLDGRSLSSVLEEEGRLPSVRVVDLGLQLADGLAAAHRERVLHRDLKPSNVFLEDDEVKIVDFGIARSLDEPSAVAETGTVIGSPLYMAPEQIRGEALDERSDLYSLGVLLYTCLAGHEPFEGATVSAVALKHLQDPPPDLRHVDSEIDPDLLRILERLLQKDPEDRPDSAETLGRILENLNRFQVP